MHIVTVLTLCLVLSLQKNYMRISFLMQNEHQKQLILVWTARQGVNQRKKSSQKGILFPGKPGLALKTSAFVSSKEQRFWGVFCKIYNVTMVKCIMWLYKDWIFSTDLCIIILSFSVVPRLLFQRDLLSLLTVSLEVQPHAMSWVGPPEYSGEVNHQRHKAYIRL